jgi:hypothetical protein
MSLFSRIAGAVASFFQFGGPSGPGLNDNAGVLEAKDSTNTVFTNMRGADPVGSNDFVTLEYFQAHPPSVNVPQALSQTRFQYWSGVPATTGSGVSFGSNCLLVIGSSNLGVYQSATNLLQSCSRGTDQTTGAGPVWLGSYDFSAGTGSYKESFVLRGAAAGIGGFTHTTRFGIEEVSATPTLQCFVGLMDASGGGGGLPQNGSVDWTTQTTLQVVGIAFTQNLAVSGFGNYKIVSCNGVTTTDTDSGVPIVVGNLVELILVALPNAATIAWTINDLTATTTTSGVITTSLPVNTLALAWQAGMNVEVGNAGSPNVFSTVRYTMDSNF